MINLSMCYLVNASFIIISYKNNKSKGVTPMTFTGHVDLREKDLQEKSIKTGSQFLTVDILFKVENLPLYILNMGFISYQVEK